VGCEIPARQITTAIEHEPLLNCGNVQSEENCSHAIHLCTCVQSAEPAAWLYASLASACPQTNVSLPWKSNSVPSQGSRFYLAHPEQGRLLCSIALPGLVAPDAGSMPSGNIPCSTRPKSRRAHAETQVGYVFQDLALFPHLTAEQNVHTVWHILPRNQPSTNAVRRYSGPSHSQLAPTPSQRDFWRRNASGLPLRELL